MRSYTRTLCGLLVAASAMVSAGCANDDNPSAVHASDLGVQKGEVLVPYEPVVVHKITQDPSQFPMPAAPAPASAPVAAEAPAAAGTETPMVAASSEAAASATPPDMASLPPSPEGEQLAAQMMDDLSNGKYTDIEARFGPEIKTLLPPGTLKMQWGQAAEQLGPYQSIQTSAGRKVSKDGQTYDYAEAVLQFSRGTAVLMVAFDSQKQIVQLSIVPGQARERGTETESPAPAPETPAAPAPAAETPAVAPARPAPPPPPAAVRPAAPARPSGAAPPRPGAPAAPSRSGSGSANMDMLPPTAPAPVGGLGL